MNDLREQIDMEPVEVTARFNPQGQATPLSFVWQGSTYPIESTGRRWEDEAGQHILVMIPAQRAFELLFSRSEGRWYLKDIGGGKMMA